MSDNIRKVREERTIKYEFSEEELKQIATDTAQAVGRRDRWENVKKVTAKHLKDKIDSLQLDISSMCRDHRRGYKQKTVPCEVHFDFDQNEVRIYRQDTNALVDSRAMTEDERQREMFDDGGHNITAPVDETDDESLLNDESLGEDQEMETEGA